MCLAIPMKVTKIEDKTAFAEVGGTEYKANTGDRKSTRLNSSHYRTSRMPSSA